MAVIHPKIPACLHCGDPIDAHDPRTGECLLFGCSCTGYEPVDPRDHRR